MIEYQRLAVWQKARILTKEIYSLTKTFPKSELFILNNQMQRCAISVPSNIAEGIGRNTVNDKIHFLYIARGSLFELETQCVIAFDQNYLGTEQLKKISLQIKECKQLINGFIKYLKSKK